MGDPLDHILDDTGPDREPWTYAGERTELKRLFITEVMRRVFVAGARCTVQIVVPLSGTFGWAIDDSVTEGDSGMFQELAPLPPGATIKFNLEQGQFLTLGVESGSFPISILAQRREG